MSKTKKMEKINIDLVKENPENPRFITNSKFKKLVKSLKDFPQMLEKRPIVVDEDMIVLGGNMRLKACKEAGLKEVYISVAKNWSEKQKSEFIIKDNLAYGEWDWELVANAWEKEQLDDWGLDIPLSLQLYEVDEEEDNYQEPEDLKIDVIEGDIIQIGNHKILCGDSTKVSEWKKLMNEEICDLVITDPPYNVDYTGGTKDKLKIMNDNKSDSDFYQFLYDFYSSLNSFVKKGGAWYVWHADSEGANFRKAMIDAGISLKQCLIWVKDSLVLGRQDYHWRHEPCLYGWKPGKAHSWYQDRKQSTVIESFSKKYQDLEKYELIEFLDNLFSELPTSLIKIKKPKKNNIHPTMKPIKLIGYQIKNSSQPKDLVCDGFLGGGSTMVAAHQLGRKCYGMELDPRYCQVIIDRMQKLDPSISVKINGKKYN